MTENELKNFDGREGRKAYVAVSGTIYDVTESTRWVEGDHVGAHQAGADLTEELKAAPHVRSLIERFPVVGKLESEPVQEKSGKKPLWIIPVAAVAALLLFTMLR